LEIRVKRKKLFVQQSHNFGHFERNPIVKTLVCLLIGGAPDVGFMTLYRVCYMLLFRPPKMAPKLDVDLSTGLSFMFLSRVPSVKLVAIAEPDQVAPRIPSSRVQRL
jgi:hypothetical protein